MLVCMQVTQMRSSYEHTVDKQSDYLKHNKHASTHFKTKKILHPANQNFDA